MKSITYCIILIVLLLSPIARSDVGSEVQSGCPIRLPLLATEQVSVSWKYDAIKNLYAYRYSVANPASSSDSINVFWIGGVHAGMEQLGSPNQWLGIPGNNSVLWMPLAPYTGPELSFVSAVMPSDLDIAPGQTQDGFTITSAQPPALVLYKIQPRRVIHDAPALRKLEPGMSEEETEAVAEANMEACGALHGDIKDLSRYGVTIGPGTIPAPIQNGLTFRPATARPGSFELTLPLPSAATLAAPIDAVWFYGFEKGQQTVRVGATDISITPGLIKLTAPPALLDLYTCRTTAALVEFRAGKVPVLRSSLSAQQLGLPASCM